MWRPGLCQCQLLLTSPSQIWLSICISHDCTTDRMPWDKARIYNSTSWKWASCRYARWSLCWIQMWCRPSGESCLTAMMTMGGRAKHKRATIWTLWSQRAKGCCFWIQTCPTPRFGSSFSIEIAKFIASFSFGGRIVLAEPIWDI